MEYPEVRLSDAERHEALDALNEHVHTGRLDIAEYGERSAEVTAARTRGELEKLFADLPHPRPAVLDESPTSPASDSAAAGGERPLLHRAAGAALPIAAGIVVVLLVLGARTYAVFLLPIAAAVIAPLLFRNRQR